MFLIDERRDMHTGSSFLSEFVLPVCYCYLVDFHVTFYMF